MSTGCVDQALVDESLCGRVPAVALADGNLLGTFREGERPRVNQRVVEQHIGALEQTSRTQGQQVGRAGSRANEIDGASHSISPAATVLLVTSSMTMKLPVT